MAEESVDGQIGYDFIVQVKDGKVDEVKALVAEHPAAVKHAEDYGFTIGCTGLHHAAKEGYTDIVELLIIEGADVKALSSFGTTPFHHATTPVRMVISRYRLPKL